MTLTTPYSATFIVGDGETKTFSYLFEEVSPNFISVMVYNSVTGLISTPTYVIDTDQKQVIFGEDTPAPTADETVCIYRNTPNVQDVAFRTLHGYDAQTLENILSKIVAMIQEIKSNYFSTQVLQGDPWQLDLLSSADDGATVNIDYTAKKLVKGLYFRITSGNLQVSADGANYMTLPKSEDVAEFRQYEQTLPDLTVIRKLQYRVGNQWFDAGANAQNTVSWGGILGDIDDQTDLKIALDGKVDKAGDTMSGALNISNVTSSNAALLTLTHSNTATYKWNIAPRYNSATLSVYPGTTETNGYRFASAGFVPASNNVRYLGSASLKWKGVYTGVINNGYDIAVPVTNSADTFALESEITDINGKIPAQASTSNQLADKNFVNSSIATNTANFIGTFNSVADLEAYSGTVTNNDYAFVIGTDSAGNTTYNRYKYTTATTPASWIYEYTLNNSSFTAAQWATINSGATATDVAKAQSAVQPGDLATVATTGAYSDLSGTPTIPTVNDPTITITQGGVTKGSFTLNQATSDTIVLDADGGINMIMPDYANGVSIATTATSYTAPSAGWFCAQIGPATNSATISVNGVLVLFDGTPNVMAGMGHMIPVSQGDVITWTPGIYLANFFPCKGA